MASTQARTRPGAFGIGTSASNGGSNKGFGSGFGNGSAAWNGGIWSAGSTIGSGLKSSGQESGRGQNDLQQATLHSPEIITGSKSLLSPSESDGFNHRHGSWKSIEDASPSLSRVQTNTSGASPIRRQPSNQLLPPSFPDGASASATYFSPTPGSTTISSRSSQKNFLDPTSGSFVSGAFDAADVNRTSRHNSDEHNRFAARKQAFDGSEIGLGMQSTRPSFNNNASGYNSSAASRSGSIPPSRSDLDALARHPAELQNSHGFRFNNTSAPQRGNLSAQAPIYTMPTRPSGQRYADQLSPSRLNQMLGDLRISKENQSPYSNRSEAPYGTSPHFRGAYPQEPVSDNNELWSRDEHAYQNVQDRFSPTGSGPGFLASNQTTRRGMGFGAQHVQPPQINTARPNPNGSYPPGARYPSAYQPRAPASGGSNSPLLPGQAAALDGRLRGLQEQQQAYRLSRSSPIPYNNQLQFPQAYDFHSQSGVRMNQLNPYYQIGPVNQQVTASHIPRGPAGDHPAVQPVRSALLEEFRNNSKTNKRYELKDIYNYIVEFSGDQHGSRFIQQKLETANSDEKDQVFRELHPNAIQLMTDVFGNYVIQKFFEHGNQSQKKILANQMRTHILTLSTQMYGCRVVQKALEHILTDQQAQLVKELEHNVLKCVRDQNGNHVVQKAIERVPAEYIQFILNSFTGQVHSLATDQYGCRVIQRMLEHCEEHTQTAVLQEIHAAASSLILDQYGNYVAQHIIEHGRVEDRTKLINLVISQITNFSKHKFASNVVEKSIQHGTEEERKRIITKLTVVNEKGESPSQSLIRDQYGNYVIQKVLNLLQGAEREDFVELIKAQLALLKRFAYGKQIAAIEKLIYTTPYPPPHISHTGLLPPAIDTSAAPTPPLLTDTAQSPQSSSLPSTRADSYDGPNDSRKSSGSNAIGVMTPTST